MKSLISFVLLSLVGLSALSKDLVVFNRSQLLDKIKGGWAGQVIGCTYGGPTEFRWRGEQIPDNVPITWNKGCIKWYYDNQPGLYDDVYMDLTFLDVFDRLGMDAPVDSFAMAFAHAAYPLWHANQAARYNLLNGVMPPLSGHWRNNPHADDIDYQIEADYAGLMSPAMPNAASEVSDKIGHIMNYGNGWYGGVYVGAMYALAFTSTNIEEVVTEALKVIPKRSSFYACMNDIITWHGQTDDWRECWRRCQSKWNDERGCPEGVNAPLNIDAMVNCAYILIGLLYGDGDFERTMEISTRCGQDSDCNPASAAGILGTMVGYNRIPEKWMANLREVEDLDFAFTKLSLRQVYLKSFEQALEMVRRNGGTVSDEVVSIPRQTPKPVRWEESFEGLTLGEVRSGAALDQLGPVTFEGAAIVMSGYVSAPSAEYVAQIEVVVDGRPLRRMQAPADFKRRTAELYWNYDLPEGHHTVELRWLNPAEKCRVECTRIITYHSKK